VLIRCGARGDAEDSVKATALMKAAEFTSRATVKEVLEAEGWRTVDKKWNGVTALMMATEKGRQDNVKELLRWGADAEVKDGNGKTAKEKVWRNERLRETLDNFKPHPLMAVIKGDDLNELWARVS
jgi:hypothetical protein